jgi:hypothetical protein
MAGIAAAYAHTGHVCGLNISHGVTDDAMREILTDARLAIPPRLARGNPGPAAS